jgi:hypothetical protein
MRCEKFKNTLCRKASGKIVFKESFTIQAARDYIGVLFFPNRFIQLIDAAIDQTKYAVLLNRRFIMAGIIHRFRFF